MALEVVSDSPAAGFGFKCFRQAMHLQFEQLVSCVTDSLDAVLSVQ